VEFYNQAVLAQYNDNKGKQMKAVLDARRQQAGMGLQVPGADPIGRRGCRGFAGPEELAHLKESGFLTDPVVQRILRPWATHQP